MSSIEKKLVSYFRQLDSTQQQTALDFLAFLTTRSAPALITEIPQPVEILRPPQESVVKAIKRLRATYPMLEPGKLLNDTSSQMTRHMIHGVSASEVIDELERVFKQHYETHIAQYH